MHRIAAHARMWPGVHGRFYGFDKKKKEMVRLGKQAVEVTRLVYEENDSRFEVQREEYWGHTRATGSIAAARERLLELFCD